jgi:GNAT superfamily N-acetyltransferase
MSLYYNSNQICFQKIDINWAFIEIYKGIFPEIAHTIIKDPAEFATWRDALNGSYGSHAVWYGLFSCAGEPYDWSHLLAFCTIGDPANTRFQMLYNFAVLPDYRRMGYATQFLEYVIKQFDADRNIYLFVKKDNRGAIRLYRQFHFEFDDHSFLPPQGQICLVRYKVNYCEVVLPDPGQATGLLKKSQSPLT